jgi:serine/threonine-protein kinase
MELHRLGGFRLQRRLATRSTTCQHWLARLDASAEGDDAASADHASDAGAGYVLKLLLPDGGPAYAAYEAQFEHECRLLEAFNHPAIPTYHGHGTHDGVRWLAMDHVDGVDLAALLGHDGEASERTRSLPKEIALFVAGQLADALDHIHTLATEAPDGEVVSMQILHRDVAPANVLVSRLGDVYLCDFGSASSRWLAPRYTARDAGTKAYMAPERVIGGGEASIRTDLFSLAVILWEMLKGQRCFGGGDEIKVMEAIARFDVGHASRRISGLSPRFSEVVRKNLDRDPSRRYEDAYEILQRLAQAPEAAAAEQSRLQLAALVNEHLRQGHAAAV